jgi:two-component system nitrate/nitrite response regulator NarP
MIPVLLADDHPFMRAGIEAVLRGSRYTVVATAADGDEALAAIQRHEPAIAILDVRMPRRDGVAVLEALRARGDRRSVVLLTAEIDDLRLYAAVRAEVNGIVLKNGAEDALIGCLDTVMAGGRAIDPDLVDRALRLSLDGGPRDAFATLTPRERQIAQLVAEGLRNREIAERLTMSEGTVKVYLHAIYKKLGVENRTSLAMLAHASNGS